MKKLMKTMGVLVMLFALVMAAMFTYFAMKGKARRIAEEKEKVSER